MCVCMYVYILVFDTEGSRGGNTGTSHHPKRNWLFSPSPNPLTLMFPPHTTPLVVVLLLCLFLSFLTKGSCLLLLLLKDLTFYVH